MSLPSKLYFRIGEVSELVGVEPHVLRYWEREFRAIRPTKSAKGQRVYSRRDVETLLRVKELLYTDGFTIAGARRRLHGGSDAGATAHDSSATAHDSTLEVAGTAKKRLPREAARTEATPAVAPIAETRGPRESATALRSKLLEARSELSAFLDELQSS